MSQNVESCGGRNALNMLFKCLYDPFFNHHRYEIFLFLLLKVSYSAINQVFPVIRLLDFTTIKKLSIPCVINYILVVSKITFKEIRDRL